MNTTTKLAAGITTEADTERSGPMTMGKFALKSGQRIRYAKAGAGRPLVLIHTLRTQIEYFKDVVPLLARDFTVYAIDLPGHGESSIDTSAPYDEPYLRQAVVEFVLGMDLHDVVIAGESIGAVLALTASAQLGDRVRGVAASNAYDYDQRYADGVRRGNFLANFILFNFSIPVMGAVFAALENVYLLAGILRGGVRHSIHMPMGLVKIFDRTGRRSGYRYVERKMFSGWRSWGAARQLYGQVGAPVLLLQAEHDWSRAEERRRSAQALKDAAVVELEDAGHFAFLEQPRRMADLIRAKFAAS